MWQLDQMEEEEYFGLLSPSSPIEDGESMDEFEISKVVVGAGGSTMCS